MSRGPLEEAREALRKGRPNRAIELLRASLAASPDDPELRYTLAEAYRKAKNDERAFDHFQKAAAQLVARGELEAGYRAYEQALSIRSEEAEILFRCAECAKQLGLWTELERYLLILVRRASSAGDRRRLWALETLASIHPDDLSVQQQRAEALAEADRLDESIDLYKRIARRVHEREADYVHVLFRAAHLAAPRPDLGAELAQLMLDRGRAKDALAIVVGFYERQPDHVAVLETLVRCLETLHAEPKARVARVELVKARAREGRREQTLIDVDGLLLKQPDDPAALEVAAHALGMVREPTRALELWRRLLRLAIDRRMRPERDRAAAALLKQSPHDEDGLKASIVAAVETSRFGDADELRGRLEAVRALRGHAVAPDPASPQRAPHAVRPAPLRSAPPPPPQESTSGGREPSPTSGTFSGDFFENDGTDGASGTQMLLEADVVSEIVPSLADDPEDATRLLPRDRPLSNPWTQNPAVDLPAEALRELTPELYLAPPDPLLDDAPDERTRVESAEPISPTTRAEHLALDDEPQDHTVPGAPRPEPLDAPSVRAVRPRRGA